MSSSEGVTISFDRFPQDVAYKLVNLSFTLDTTAPGQRILATGTVVDEKGSEWFAVLTDQTSTYGGAEEKPIIYKLYNKTKSDKARDRFFNNKKEGSSLNES